jgi:hypothetical protein
VPERPIVALSAMMLEVALSASDREEDLAAAVSAAAPDVQVSIHPLDVETF